MKIIYVGAEVGYYAMKDVVGGRSECEHVEAEPGALGEALKGADALLDASMKVKITNQMIEDAVALKIISCATTGSDHIERKELNRRSIPVRSLKEDRDVLMNLTPAAELSWALLMACARKLPAAFDHVKSGAWVRELFPGRMLRGRRIGVVGCGRIGGWMGRYARAFGMEVVGFDPHVDPFPEGFIRLDLHELARSSDFITVHVHLSDETRHLISREIFEVVKPGAILINTSRGAVVEETAMLNALESGRLGGAGLDVVEGEPDIDNNPLVRYARTHDNLIITPHCGGFSPDAVAIVCAHSARKIVKELGLDS